MDDNSMKTSIQGGPGEDSVKIGQLYNSARNSTAANLSLADSFDTVETTIGYLR
jgi:hypothetical protein